MARGTWHGYRETLTGSPACCIIFVVEWAAVEAMAWIRSWARGVTARGVMRTRDMGRRSW